MHSRVTRDRIDIGRATGALAPLAAFGTWVAHLAYDDFYRGMGLTLGEIGLSTTRMLGLGALGALYFVGCAVVTVAVGYPAYVFLYQWWHARLTAGLFGAACGFAAFLAVALAVGATGFWPIFPLLGGAGLFGGFLLPAAAEVIVRRTTRASVLVAYLVIPVVAYSILASAASAGRSFHRWHNRPASDRPVVSTFLDIAPQRVCVQSPSLQGERLLLGSANGMVVLYDIHERQATRLPVGSIIRLDSPRSDGTC